MASLFRRKDMDPSGNCFPPDNAAGSSGSSLTSKGNVTEPQHNGRKRRLILNVASTAEQTTPATESRQGPSRPSEVTGSSSSLGQLGINLTIHESVKHFSQADRDSQCSQADKLYRVAKYLKLNLTDLRLDPESFLPTWNGRDDDLKRLDAQGKLKGLLTEPVLPPSAKRARTGNAGSDMWKTPLTPRVRAELEGAIMSVWPRASVWHPLHNYLSVKATPGMYPTVEDSRLFLISVQDFIVQTRMALRPYNTCSRYWTLNMIIRLMLTAAGISHRDDEFPDYEDQWDYCQQRFNDIGEETGRAIEAIYALRNVRAGLEIARPMIAILRESPLIVNQQKLYEQAEKELDDLKRLQ
ncbi:polyketide synthase [Fusarium albosuccineum]|uniref:Polyketide synthase n=1 Tax=Fusarium albosuccineum TaxID=1237068 RepID=A0A8H4L167_9HYPO|nr:polyketide synthase [Fusarium albosuccineum]